MFNNLDSFKNNSSIKADICIVGTGPAGITLARELIDSRLNIVILESGDLEFEMDTQNLYAGEITNNFPPVPLTASRLRYFGGTSNHWGGSCGPLSPVDLKKRSWIPNSGWPLSRKDLDPYYARAHETTGLGPFDYRPSTWTKDNTGVLNLTGTDADHIIRQVNPQRFGQIYREELKKAKNIRVIFHANLTKIRTNEATKKVTSLEAKSLSGKTAIIKARHYVLACGGVGNARLLLASDLETALPATGRYYTFHPRMRTAQLLLKDPIHSSRNPYSWHNVNNTRIKFQIGLTEDAMEREQLPNHAAIISAISIPDTAGYSAAKRLYKRLQGKRNLDGIMSDIYGVMADLDGVSSQWKRRHSERSLSLLSLDTYLDQSPHPDSRVTLGNERDALGMRRPKIQWAYHDFEPAAAKRFNQVLAQAFGASGVGRLRILENLEDDTVFQGLIHNLSGGGHQIGTTRMSTNSKTGVVDSNCKVHGLENLYCAGSSVFPTGGWINPTVTIVALATRLADHLKVQSHH